MDMAREIIKKIRQLEPPGRFLKKNRQKQWYSLSEKECLDKVSQALREGQAKRKKNKWTQAITKQMKIFKSKGKHLEVAEIAMKFVSNAKDDEELKQNIQQELESSKSLMDTDDEDLSIYHSRNLKRFISQKILSTIESDEEKDFESDNDESTFGISFSDSLGTFPVPMSDTASKKSEKTNRSIQLDGSQPSVLSNLTMDFGQISIAKPNGVKTNSNLISKKTISTLTTQGALTLTSPNTSIDMMSLDKSQTSLVNIDAKLRMKVPSHDGFSIHSKDYDKNSNFSHMTGDTDYSNLQGS